MYSTVVAMAGQHLMPRRHASLVGVVLSMCMGLWVEMARADVGVNWGTISSDPLPNNIVVKMLQDNNIVKVKLFDAKSDVIESMRGTNFEVMVAITNDMLASMAASIDAATAWVKQNVTAHIGNGGVNIKYALLSLSIPSHDLTNSLHHLEQLVS